MKKRKKGRRFKIPSIRQSPEPRAMETEPEALAVSVRRAAKEVLPIIKGVQLDLGAVQFLLAQQTQVLVPGDPRFTTESEMALANRTLAPWQEEYSLLAPAYLYTLEETLRGFGEVAGVS